MELQAVIEALRFVIQHEWSEWAVGIHTDSQYVRNGITTWIRSWLRNGWRTAAKKPVKNQDLWVRLHELDEIVHPEWHWVRGHAGNELNERCDQLVQLEIAKIEVQD
jgi:ribonuclease HI